MIVDLSDLVTLTAVSGAGLIGLVLGLTQAETGRRRPWSRRRPPAGPPAGRVAPFRRDGRPLGPPLDAADQLRLVMGAEFKAQRLLNRGEWKVFAAAERAVRDQGLGWRVMAQVSLGEILSASDEAAFRAINAKRVDVLIVARDGRPIAALEHQGSGHHLGRTAAARDAVKKEALRKAGVAFVELTDDHGAQDVAREIARLAGTVAARR